LLQNHFIFFHGLYRKFKLELPHNDDSPVLRVLDKRDGVRTDVVLN
jgi:hypothetical protein